ncbi:Elongator subunit elp4 [Rhizina undulata]
MSFRKKNIIVNRGPPLYPATQNSPSPPPPGIRPSPIDGRSTTSTGAASLDALLAGHAGLPMGTSLLIEEPGTTDFSGVLLRYYAAEGLVQGHEVTVVGVPEAWGRELPGVVEEPVEKKREVKEVPSATPAVERMKIAWRYERLGEFSSGIGSNRRESSSCFSSICSELIVMRTAQPKSSNGVQFCHSFDLTKRLPPSQNLHFHPITASFAPFLSSLSRTLSTSTTPHRVLLPSFLNPTLYPPTLTTPSSLLPFIHALRSLLRQHPQKLTIMLSLQLDLYPRDTGLIRMVEHLLDGVVELTPLPYSFQADKSEEAPQGLVRVWKMPVVGERGGSWGEGEEDLAFVVSRRRFTISKFSLPPLEGEADGGGKKGAELEF